MVQKSIYLFILYIDQVHDGDNFIVINIDVFSCSSNIHFTNNLLQQTIFPSCNRMCAPIATM